MAINLLTDTKIRQAKCPLDGEVMLSDGGKLYLLLRSGDAKFWSFQYRFDGKKRKRGLGAYPDVTLTSARRAAAECRSQLAQGIDPIQEAEQARAARRQEVARQAGRLTIRQLFADWKKNQLSRRKDGGASAERAFEKDVFPMVGDRKADEITRKDVHRILDKIKERNVPRTVKLILALLRQMFSYAIIRDVRDSDPTFGIKKRDVGGPDKFRDRHLSEDEIRELAVKLPESGLSSELQAAVWIQLATICRIGELTRARWNEFDLEKRTWAIPAENAKNGRRHLVHLSDFAISHLLSLPGPEVSPWLFPGRDESEPFNRQTIQKLFRDRQRPTSVEGRSTKTGSLVLSGGTWTSHDLRRSGATLMGERKVTTDVINRCLNHIESNRVTQTYQRQELMEERRRAFEVLGDYLEEILVADTNKVVRFIERR